MKFYAVNGSPRKKNNTAILLQEALDGVKSVQAKDAETELIHLYDYNYKPCVSCFQCKLLDGKSYGQYALNDELTPILKKLAEADGIIFGSPIYLGNITGGMRSFFERFLFQYLVYDAAYSSLAPQTHAHGVYIHHGRIRTAHARIRLSGRSQVYRNVS